MSLSHFFIYSHLLLLTGAHGSIAVSVHFDLPPVVCQVSCHFLVCSQCEFSSPFTL